MAAISKTRKGKESPRTGRRVKRKAGVNQRLVKALAHELRVEILTILNERMASPNELAQELGEGLSQVSYHVKVLRDYKCIELVKTEPRRGAVEHYYRATSRAFFTDRDWPQLPSSVRPGLSADLLELVFKDGVSALEAGTFDAREDRHMSRTPLFLDEEGWAELRDSLEKSLEDVIQIQKRASNRLAKAGGEGFNASVSIMGFEVPEPARRRDGKSKKKAARKKGKK